MADSTAYQKLEHEAGPDTAIDSDTGGHVWTQPSGQHESGNILKWLRVLLELLLVGVVIGLSLKLTSHCAERGNGRNDPRKDFGFLDKVFMNDSKFANEEALADPEKLRATLKQWLPLSSKGRGYVRVTPQEQEDMDGPPYLLNPLLRPVKKEAYMVSSMHQLHCLSTIMTSYAKLRHGDDESEMGYHIAHCFDYLRQGILCAGDSTLEGNNSATYPGVEIPWGTAHRCVNWDALRDWADERTIWNFPPGLDTL